MIARWLRWLWVVTIAVVAGAAWLSIRLFAGHIGAWPAAAAAVVAVGLVHPAVVACEFLVSRAAGDAVPAALRLAPRAALRCYLQEVAAVLRGVWIGNPFRAHVPAPRPPAGAARDVALLFVHGYFCNRSIWLAFMRDAARRGYRCEALTLDDTFASIATHAAALRAGVDALLAASGARRVAIVAHSMGGLVVRHALAAGDVDRVARVFTLGTPHRGTHAARYGRHPSVVEMRRDSAWLAAIVARETGAVDDGRTRAAYPRSRYTTLFSWHDDIVYPQSSGRLEGAECVELAGIGHVALVYDARVRTVVFERLDREAAPPVATQAAAS